MKKLITLVAAVLFTAGMAFGQDHISDVNQTGNNNQADIVQNGYDNVADVNQSGNWNDVLIDQLSSEFPPRGMNASVVQSGNHNSGEVYMKEHNIHSSTLRQSGDWNVAKIVHERNTNVSEVYQTGNYNMVDSRVHAVGSSIFVRQSGNDNYAEQDLGRNDVAGGNNVFEIYQSGNNNQAVQYLDVLSHMGDADNFSEIRQAGNDNYGMTLQSGNGHTANINQPGNGNITTIHQYDL